MVNSQLGLWMPAAVLTMTLGALLAGAQPPVETNAFVVEKTTTPLASTTAPSASECPAVDVLVAGAETTSSAPTTAPVAVPPPAEAFFVALCARGVPIAAIEAELGFVVPNPQMAEQIRAQMCDPAYVTPDADQIGVNYGLYIRGKAQADPALGEQWLEAGILTVFERTDLDDGTFTVDLDFDMDVIDQLIAADLAFVAEIDAHRAEWCSGLVTTTTTSAP